MGIHPMMVCISSAGFCNAKGKYYGIKGLRKGKQCLRRYKSYNSEMKYKEYCMYQGTIQVEY